MYQYGHFVVPKKNHLVELPSVLVVTRGSLALSPLLPPSKASIDAGAILLGHPPSHCLHLPATV